MENTIPRALRDALHAELEKALETPPSFGAIEFRITFENGKPASTDKRVTRAVRLGGAI